MLSYQEMPKYILLIYGLLALSAGLHEKCSKNLDYSTNPIASILEMLSARSPYDRNFDQCRDYKYECTDLSEEEFLEVLEDLPMTCLQTCKLNTTEKPMCDYFQGLRLISSPIFKLPEKSFQRFDSLTYLFIENTSIIDIGTQAFYNLTNLKILSLANNRIRWIADSTFRDLPMLTKLSLLNNHLANFKMIKLPLLETLILDDNRLQTIQLEDLVSLKSLSLKHNQLKKIDNCFINVHSLTTLILEYNHLEQISASDLKGLHSLIVLDISHNKIEYIDANAFSEIEKLHTLHVEDNLLMKLPGNIFTNNMNLGILTLANNHLTHLDANLFHGLRNLFMLDLDNNAISEINSETFGIHSATEKHSPADIWVVSLHNNRLQKLDLTIFHQINTLHLNVSNNQLRSLDMAQLSCDIDASFNNIGELLNGEAPNLKSTSTITDIRLSHNRIQNIRSGQFRRFSKLENLTLDNNQITKLPYGIFDGLQSLTYLNLSSNKIDTCPPVVFSDLPQLETLIMSNNVLQSLEMDKLLMELPELKTFDIDSNKWECNYLQIILFSDAVRSRKDISFKSNQYTKRSTSLHSIKGVSCSDSTEHNMTTENNTQNSKNDPNEIYEKIIKQLEERNQQNAKLVPAESSAVTGNEDMSKYEDHFSGIKSGIIVLIIFVVLISLFSVYTIYENRRWRQQSGMHRISLNTMMEDI